MNKLTKRVFTCFLLCILQAASISSCSKSTGLFSEPKTEIEMNATESKPAARIAFSSGPHGNFEIFIMNQDGSEKTQITNNPASDTNPVWSNDGQKIAFVSDRDGSQKIYVMDADGSNQVRLTSGSGIEFGADWSPDDKKILFTSFQDGRSDVFVINADGSNIIRLTLDHPYNVGGQWSPDGKKILYSSEIDGNYEVIVANADGSEPVNLTNNPARDSCAAWSPDGQVISFNSDRGGKEAIYRMNSDGSAPTLLVSSDGYLSCTDWSQDGKKLTFNQQVNGYSEIYVMDPDGGNITSISDTAAGDYDPNWSPGVTIKIVARAATPTPITPTTTFTTTPIPLPVCTQSTQIDEKWEAVAKSDDIDTYAEYLRATPDTTHLVELTYLVDHFLREKIKVAVGEGRQIEENATLIPFIAGGGPFGQGTTMTLGGGYYPDLFVGWAWYIDPTALITIQLKADGIHVLEGRGLAIGNDTIFEIGLPATPMQPDCQN